MWFSSCSRVLGLDPSAGQTERHGAGRPERTPHPDCCGFCFSDTDARSNEHKAWAPLKFGTDKAPFRMEEAISF
jgi:hypothetical protein